jgi:hypothetical protein
MNPALKTAVVFGVNVALKTVPFKYGDPQGLVLVLQITVAEAVPAPKTTNTAAIAAAIASPFRNFILCLPIGSADWQALY